MCPGVAEAIEAGVVSKRVLLVGKRLNIDDAMHDAKELVAMADDGLADLRERIRTALVRFRYKIRR